MRRIRRLGREGLSVAAAGVLLFAACTETLDAGFNRPHGPLPVDQTNPVILYQDDWSGDWLGEYAVLLASSGGPPLADIIINASKTWGDLGINTSGWNDLVNAASASGLPNIPDVTSSAGVALTMPANGQIDSTTPNNSLGAQHIRDVSSKLSQPNLPVVVVSGTSLTDLADAYLIDHTVVDRVVVVASLGGYSAPNASMNAPNGDMDPWADWIVAQRFRYIQVSAYYDQTGRRHDDGSPQPASKSAGQPVRDQAAQHHQRAASCRSGRASRDGAAGFHGFSPADVARHVRRIRWDPRTAAGARSERQRLGRHPDRGAAGQVEPLADAPRSANVRTLTAIGRRPAARLAPGERCSRRRRQIVAESRAKIPKRPSPRPGLLWQLHPLAAPPSPLPLPPVLPVVPEPPVPETPPLADEPPLPVAPPVAARPPLPVTPPVPLAPPLPVAPLPAAPPVPVTIVPPVPPADPPRPPVPIPPVPEIPPLPVAPPVPWLRCRRSRLFRPIRSRRPSPRFHPFLFPRCRHRRWTRRPVHRTSTS